MLFSKKWVLVFSFMCLVSVDAMDGAIVWCVNNSKQLRKQILFTALQYGRQNAIDTAPVPTKFIIEVFWNVAYRTGLSSSLKAYNFF